MGTFNFMSPEVIEDLSGGPMDDGEEFEVNFLNLGFPWLDLKGVTDISFICMNLFIRGD